MIPNYLYRRNRFKSRAKKPKSGSAWPKLQIDWKSHGRKAAVLALAVCCLGALSWALNRPVRAISNAVRTVASSLAGSVIKNTCFATAPMMLGTGAS